MEGRRKKEEGRSSIGKRFGWEEIVLLFGRVLYTYTHKQPRITIGF
jgi:hypothetical protein